MQSVCFVTGKENLLHVCKHHAGSLRHIRKPTTCWNTQWK